ncbi:hypothetical protein PGA7_00004620 [Porphyromonas gingivalis]|nr:hypothetical protein PGA7_00004620 [Porphyromonas gingivalis]
MNPVSAIVAYCFYDNKPEIIFGKSTHKAAQ